MSNGPSHPVNLTRIASKSLSGGHAPLPGSGESAKKDADKYKPVTEHTMVKRTIPVTDFQPPEAEGDLEAEANGAAPPTAPDAAAEKDRHTKWREAQEAKRAARQQANAEAAAKRQGLANELLKKGDLPGAAKAIGMPVAEFLTLVNQAAIGMKPEDPPAKELTPQEKRDADEAAFRADMKAFRKEQEDFRFTQAMTGFIEKNIRPVLADKDAYEMVHAAGVADIETYAYQYMNQHYQETTEKDAEGKVTKPGEILNAKEVLDAIEENLVKQHVQTLERARALKKVSKYFAPAGGKVGTEPGAETSEEVETDPLDKAGSTGLTGARRRQVAEAMAAIEAETEEPSAPEAPPPGDPSAPKIVRVPSMGANVRAVKFAGGRLTAAEKIARVRAEEEEAARASLARRR